MPNRSTDTLFQLIQSLERAEKRHFKLFMKTDAASGDLKVVQLFDALDKMTHYDEEALLKKNDSIQKSQLSNLKARLYQEVLASLRDLKKDSNIDLQLHEQLDFARVLYNKGLYLQSLKILDKAKELAKANNQVTYVLQVLFLEKKIEALHITRSMQDRADLLTNEVEEVNVKLASIGTLSNISLQLYSWYIKNGHARNDNDKAAIENLFNPALMDAAKDCDGFYEKLYKFQCYCWYAFILQDFLLYYRYCQKWVDLFETEPKMIEIETAHYIKGMHNLMSAHFDLRNYTKFNETICRFEAFTQTPTVLDNQNNTIQTFVYLHLSKINRHFMEGTFEASIAEIPLIEEKLIEYELFLDRHRVLVFYYKFASLYFGAGNYSASIDYLNKVINLKGDLRTDLQCYARLLHLIAHYELGNFEILEHLLKSVTRFMAKMENLGLAEAEIFGFLKRAFRLQPSALKPAFEKLLENLKAVEQDKLASRAFMYLDVISWLESKIEGKEVQDIIRDKYLRSIKE